MPGLRERKKQATRAELSAAALRLAALHGPEAVTVEQISEAAGVSPRTFFNYFPSKEDAILGTDPDRATEAASRVASRPPGEPPLEVLRVALTDLAAELAEDPDAWSRRMQLVRRHPTLLPRHLAAMAALERAMTVALAERLQTDPDGDPYPGLVAAAAVSVARTCFRRWHAGSRAVPLEVVLGDAFAQLARGLPLPPRLSHPIAP